MGLLDDVRVRERARDHRARAEAREVRAGELEAVLVHGRAQVAAHVRGKSRGELVAHGMRSIARTAAEESGKFRAEVLEAALAHSKKDEIIAAYNRAEYLIERQSWMQWWSDYVQAQRSNALVA